MNDETKKNTMSLLDEAERHIVDCAEAVEHDRMEVAWARLSEAEAAIRYVKDNIHNNLNPENDN